MKKEIDTITFDFTILEQYEPSEIKERPEYGSYIHGLFIEGAEWNHRDGFLDDSAPKVLFNKMPCIWFKPYQLTPEYVKDKSRNDYSCPVYKTSKRAGVLTTTGHSTNYVISIDVPIKKQAKEEEWILKGVAMLTQLDD
jgi:dynein heavy chain